MQCLRTNLTDKKDIIATIVDVTTEGLSVAKDKKCVYFVKGGVIGDIVSLEITRQKKNYFEAKILKTLQDANQKVKSDCPYSERCGGCTFREYSYDLQLKTKSGFVVEKLKRISGLKNFQLDNIIKAQKINHYRNNVQLKCAFVDGKLQIGFFEKLSHTVVNIEKCLLLPAIMNDLIKKIKNFLQKLYAQNESKTIFNLINLQEIILRTNEKENALMLIFVKKYFSKNISFYKNDLIDFAISNNIISIYEQNSKKELKLIFGKKTLNINLCSLNFELFPDSFFQIHTKQAELLFSKVLRLLEPVTSDIIFDLFCGVGSISLIVAHYVKKVLGIEIVQNAVENAKANATINKIKNANFIFGSVESTFNNSLLSNYKFQNVKIILDPPRAGVNQKTLELMCTLNPKKIIYISCNPATFARDVKILSQNNFTIKNTSIIDMFPYTSHVETVALLTK